MRVLLFYGLGLLVTLVSACGAREPIQSVPREIQGEWIEHLPVHEVAAECSPARLIATESTITENAEVCAPEEGRTETCAIQKVYRQQAWLLSTKTNFVIVCSVSGIDGSYTWVFETVESFDSVHVRVSGPTGAARRDLGEFVRP